MRKLSDSQIIDIFYETGSITYFKNKYGIDIRTVKNIKAQLWHKHITCNLTKPGQIIKYGLSPVNVEDIYTSSKTYKELASQFNVHIETVRNIKKGLTRSYEEWF